ncbi:PKD domain-containing protein [Methanoculleus thermophilus]|jgi:beta propeller repeat protein|nr:PKD domain-containing protein [Methanoculleus thermophilus]
MTGCNILILVCTVVALGLLASPSMAGEMAPGNVVPVSIEAGPQEYPDIDGDMIVWVDGRKSIYYSSGPGVRAWSVAGEGGSPSVSGDYIVWEEILNMSLDICLFDLSGGVTRVLTDDPTDQWMPVIYGERVAWYDARSGSTDICLYDIGTGNETFISCSPVTEWRPALSERYLVWEEGSGNGDIWLYDILTGERRQITENSARQTYPSISGSRIVWEDYRNGAPDIYLFDLEDPAAGEQRITDDPAEQVSPAIDGDLIAWEDKRDGTWNIYICDLALGTDKQMPVAPSSTEQLYPAVSNDRIVWQNGRGERSDIYAFTYFRGAIPVAEFSANPTEGNAVLFVRFTDRSTGGPETWFWDLGDGYTSTERNPWHLYEFPGNYTVSLTVSNEFGSDTVTKSELIHVGPLEIREIQFQARPLAGPVPLKVLFLGDEPNYARSWYWDFGDGGTSSHRDPMHTYRRPGVYNVTLTCTYGGINLTHTEYGFITVYERLEPSFLADPVNGTAPLSVRFTDTSTGGPESWLWDFGDGVTSSEQNPEHTYLNPGTYTVSLMVGSAFQNETAVKHGYIQVVPAPTPTVSPTLPITPTPSPTVPVTPTESPTVPVTPTPTVNVTPTVTPTASATPTPTVNVTPTPTQTSPGSGSSGGGGGGRGGGGGGGGGSLAWTDPGWRTPASTAGPTPRPTATSPSGADPAVSALQFVSPDGLVSLTIAGGISAVKTSGAPVTTVTLESLDVDSVPPISGEGRYVFTGFACLIGPDGAALSQPATLVFNFSQDQWEALYDDDRKRLVVQRYNRSADAWEEAITTVHPGSWSISAEISSSGLYALCAEVSEEGIAEMAMDGLDPQFWTGEYTNLIFALLALIILCGGTYLYFRKDGL